MNPNPGQRVLVTLDNVIPDRTLQTWIISVKVLILSAIFAVALWYLHAMTEPHLMTVMWASAISLPLHSLKKSLLNSNQKTSEVIPPFAFGWLLTWTFSLPFLSSYPDVQVGPQLCPGPISDTIPHSLPGGHKPDPHRAQVAESRKGP